MFPFRIICMINMSCVPGIILLKTFTKNYHNYLPFFYNVPLLLVESETPQRPFFPLLQPEYSCAVHCHNRSTVSASLEQTRDQWKPPHVCAPVVPTMSLILMHVYILKSNTVTFLVQKCKNRNVLLNVTVFRILQMIQ